MKRIMRVHYFPMSHDEFRTGLKILGMTQAEFSRLLDVADRTVRMWTVGDRGVPSYAAIILRLLVANELSPEQIRSAIATPLYVTAQRHFAHQ